MISIAVAREFIEGLEFPATKEECARYAAKKKAPRALIDAILQMPGEKYQKADDFWRSYAELEAKLEMESKAKRQKRRLKGA